jgi:hypothetical protein
LDFCSGLLGVEQLEAAIPDFPNSSVHRLCPPDCVGYFEHGTLFSSEIDAIASGADDCHTRQGRKPEPALVVRIGAVPAGKLL